MADGNRSRQPPCESVSYSRSSAAIAVVWGEEGAPNAFF